MWPRRRSAPPLAPSHPRRRVKEPAEIQELLDAPQLALLPAPPPGVGADELVCLALPGSAAAAAARRLADVLDSVLGRAASTVLVTSALAGEGKSTTVANLGVELARRGRRVVLVDLDLRRPALHRFFGLWRSPGAPEAAALPAERLWSALVPIDLGLAGPAPTRRPWARRPPLPGTGALLVLPAGGPVDDPAARLADPALAALLRRLGREQDVVLVDSPPVLSVSDALTLSPVLQATIVVSGIGISTRGELADAAARLDAAGRRLLGHVVTERRSRRSSRQRDDEYYAWDEPAA